MLLMYRQGGAYPPTYDSETDTTTIECIVNAGINDAAVISVAWEFHPDFPSDRATVVRSRPDTTNSWLVTFKIPGDHSDFPVEAVELWGYSINEPVMTGQQPAYVTAFPPLP